jgi:hypothetical protein
MRITWKRIDAQAVGVDRDRHERQIASLEGRARESVARIFDDDPIPGAGEDGSDKM